MASNVEKPGKGVGGVSKEEEGTISTIPQVAPLTDDVRKKLGEVITELIFDAQEVGFELAMLKCPDREKCPLVSKTRELIKKVRELFELQRKLARK